MKALFFGMMLGFVFVTAAGAEADPTELVRRLPTIRQAGPPDVALEETIAKLGDKALPALEQELRLGILFRELDELSKKGQLRRWAVVRVLARMPGDRSTDLICRSLSDPPDNMAMRDAALQALETRKLSGGQVAAMLGNTEPAVVLAGIRHASGAPSPDLQAALERLLNPAAATAQFRNVYGAPTANADQLWEVRLAAGRALKKDMVPEMRSRAAEVLAQLKQEALHPTKPNEAVWTSYASNAELTILRGIGKLAALGEPVRDLVQAEAKTAQGDYLVVLNMALARLGDKTKVNSITDSLVTSQNPSIRLCAAITLRKLRDPAAIPALTKALRDPYQRVDGSDVGPPNRKIYPIRIVAADALVDLGKDPKEVRAIMQK